MSETTVQMFLQRCVQQGYKNPAEHLATLLAQGEVTIRHQRHQGVTRVMIEKKESKFLDMDPETMLSSTGLCLNQTYAKVMHNNGVWPEDLEYLKTSLNHNKIFYQRWHRLQGRYYPMGSLSHINHPGWRSAFEFAEEYRCTSEQWKEAGLATDSLDAVMKMTRTKKWWGQISQAIAYKDVCNRGATKYVAYADGRTDGLAHLSVWAGDTQGIVDTMLDGISPSLSLAQYADVDTTTAKTMVTPMIYGAGAKALSRVLMGDPEAEPTSEAKDMGVAAHEWFGNRYPQVVKLQQKFVQLVQAFNAKGAELNSIVDGEVITPRTLKTDPDAVKTAVRLYQDRKPINVCWFPPVMTQTPAAYLPLLVHGWEGCVVKHISTSMGKEPYLPVHDGHGCKVTSLASMQTKWSSAMQALLKNPTPYQQIGGPAPSFDRWEEVRHLKV